MDLIIIHAITTIVTTIITDTLNNL